MDDISIKLIGRLMGMGWVWDGYGMGMGWQGVAGLVHTYITLFVIRIRTVIIAIIEVRIPVMSLPEA